MYKVFIETCCETMENFSTSKHSLIRLISVINENFQLKMCELTPGLAGMFFKDLLLFHITKKPVRYMLINIFIKIK